MDGYARAVARGARGGKRSFYYFGILWLMVVGSFFACFSLPSMHFFAFAFCYAFWKAVAFSFAGISRWVLSCISVIWLCILGMWVAVFAISLWCCTGIGVLFI